MCKYNELLKLDIVWNNDTFYWFVIHNDNKIVFNKGFIEDIGNYNDLKRRNKIFISLLNS